MLTDEKRWHFVVALGLTATSFFFFQFFCPYHLFFKEQTQLFLFSSSYLSSYFQRPAWLACYSGDFLTQFFYLRGGGPLTLCLVFFAEWIILGKTIKQLANTKYAPVWALIPVATDLILHCQLSYRLSGSMGFIIVLLLFQMYLLISNRAASSFFSLAVILPGYWLAGCYIFAFPLLTVLSDISKRRYSVIKWFASGFLALGTPFLLKNNYLLPTAELYFFPNQNNSGLLLPVALALSIPGSRLLIAPGKKTRIVFLPGIIFVVAAFLTFGLKNNMNLTFEKILSLDSENYFGNTDRVLKLADKYQMKNTYASYFTNIALSQKGELPQKLMDYYQPAFYGLLLPVAPSQSWQSILFSNEALYLVGDMNLAQHSAMLGNTFSPYQRSSRMMKRLAEINLVNSDTAAANKYLRILEKTLFHSKWAKSRMRDQHPIPKWLAEKRSQIPQADTLRTSSNYEESLAFLVRQNPNNRIALDYLLCYQLLKKDLKSFKSIYDQYYKNRPGQVPSVYCQALLIGLFRENASRENVYPYRIPTETVTDFTDYTQLYEQTKGNIDRLQEGFGGTYWFYYHFATLQTQ